MAPRFYECYKSPIWVINFTDYGHRDIIDDFARKVANIFDCKGCQG